MVSVKPVWPAVRAQQWVLEVGGVHSKWGHRFTKAELSDLEAVEAGHLHRAPGSDGVRRAYVCVYMRVWVACVEEEVACRKSQFLVCVYGG